MKNKLIYLDNNATTACAPEVIEAMLPYMAESYGNPSSGHYAGRAAHRAVEEARSRLAETVCVKQHEIFFNSGATEGCNWIFLSLAKGKTERKKIAVSSIEHKAVLFSARELVHAGFEIVELPVTPAGVVDVGAAVALIDDQTALVSVQFANNETGVLQPVEELLKISHRHGAIFHCDAAQGLGKAKLDFSALPVDCATLSAHKAHGPKGVGVLFIRRGANGWPWNFPFMGGGQERNIRPGSLNVPAIVGFGKAAELICENNENAIMHMSQLQASFEHALLEKIPGCSIHGAQARRIPNTTNVAIPGIPADTLMANLPLFCISDGSACNEGAIGNSHVLKAMGCSQKVARCSVRISISRYSQESEINELVAELLVLERKLPHF